MVLNKNVRLNLELHCSPNSKIGNIMQTLGQSTSFEGFTTKYFEMGGVPLTLSLLSKTFLTGKLGLHSSGKFYISENHDCRVSRGDYRLKCLT